MNSVNSQESMGRIADVLGYLCKKGVRLWSENGQLRYKAPRDALTHEEIESLRLYRGQIVALLETAIAAQTGEPNIESRVRLDRAPLTFSQLAHWHLHRLSERRSTRQIVSATRLRGRLNVDVLQKSVAELVHRHDALRTRIVVLDGVPIQEISESGDGELGVDDLTATPESLREAEAIRTIEQYIDEPIDVAVDPLFGARLLKVRDNDHVLILATEHIISDLFSLNILLRDLFTAYMQALKGRAFSLPPVSVRFADYAVWQRNVEKSWVDKHGAYWNERLAVCPRLRFPEDRSSTTETHLGWGTVPLRIDRDLKRELRDWSRLRQTTLVMSVFTAYVALVLRWCNGSEAVILYATDGRVSARLENTIGFFASVLYVRIRLLEDDSFVDLLNRLTDEYCKAHAHADLSYMTAQVPRPEFTRNTAFNWVPQGSKTDVSDLPSEDAITCSPINFAHTMVRNLELDAEPSVLLFDADDEIVGDVCFPLNRFSSATMERFGRNFLVFVRALVKQPEGHVNDVLLA